MGEQNSVCQCGSINSRDSIFERSVQDPFCSVLYRLDREGEQEDPEYDETTFNEQQEENGQQDRDMQSELDPLQEEPYSTNKEYVTTENAIDDEINGSSNGNGNDDDNDSDFADDGVNPFRPTVPRQDVLESREWYVCPNCHRHRKQRSKSFASNGAHSFYPDVKPISRANSIVLPLSKQSTRQSIGSDFFTSLDSGDNYAHLQQALGESGHPHSHSNSNSNLNSNINQNQNQGQHVPEANSLSGSRSSISLSTNHIPTHLYSLERYISSELDSATESFFDKSKMLGDEGHHPHEAFSSSFTKLSLHSSPDASETTLPNTQDQSQGLNQGQGQSQSHNQSRRHSHSHSPSSPTSPFTHKHKTNNDHFSPPFLDARKRKKSFIELALAESFS